jgi:oligopeptide transport system ATP-binding protein
MEKGASSMTQSTAVTNEILTMENVKMYFPIKKGVFRHVIGHVKAVDSITLSLKKGETLCLVGESGSGKTTLGKVVVGLYEATGGKILYNGEMGAYEISSKRMPLRIRQKIQMIFQNPYSSLDPRLTIEKTLSEGLELTEKFKGKSQAEISEYLSSFLNQVGLSKEYLFRYPHELSGGQRQRIALVRAMSLEPELIVCDEPTSALDVSVQAQVVNLLQDFQEKFNLTYLFITHDISLAKYLSDRIAVMYLGKIVEVAEGEELFSNPLHPYTKALLQSLPRFETRGKEKGKKRILSGEVPSPINMPSGCRFRTRCPYATEKCEKYEPELIDVYGDGTHKVACHLYNK